jgi:molybdate transport system substrate-binding protein
MLVARGEAALGLVYASDAKAEKGVSVLGVFPPESHPPIIYPAAGLNSRAGTLAFLDFLQGGAAREAFEAQGFALLGGQ